MCLVWYASAESLLQSALFPDNPDDAVDFVKLAQALGAEGIRVTTKEEFADAFAKAVKMQRPVVLDCQIDQDDKVWPMVAPGAAISEVFDEMDLNEE